MRLGHAQVDAFIQLSNSAIVSIAIAGNVLSIAFFNFFGISVTKAMSAAHRMVLDSVRTFVIWGCSLLLGWEEFHALQLVGFFVLLLGTAVYNEIVLLPGFVYETTEVHKLVEPACCGLYNVTYKHVESDEPFEAVDPDIPGLSPLGRDPNFRSSMHRSFTTIKELHSKSMATDEDVRSSFLSGGAITPKSGSFVGIPR